MGFDRLSAENATLALQELMTQLGVTGTAPTDGAQAQAALTSLGTNVFHNGQSFNPTAPGAGGREAFEAGEAPEAPASPKSQFIANARTALNGGTLAANDMLLLEAMSAGLYDPNNVFTVDGQIDENERIALTAFLVDPNASLDVINGNITGAFNQHANEQALAALEAAERAEAELTAGQPMLKIKAQMAAAGLIDPSEIDGEPLTDPQIDALIDATYNNSAAYFTMIPALGDNMRDVTRNMFVNPPENYAANPEGINAVLGHLNDGRDISAIIETALETNDPDQIRMVQALTDQRVTGEWNPETLNAAEERLDNPQGGFPDSLYSATRGETVATSGIVEALENGDMYMPNEAQLATISPELAFMDAEQRVATWLSNPANHEAYAEMVATQTVSPEVTELLETRRAEVEAGIAAETAVEAAINDGVDTVTPILDLPAADIDLTRADTALMNAEAARLSGDFDAADAAMQEYLVEAEAAVISAEMSFVNNHMGAFSTAAYDLRETNPEVSSVLSSGDPEAIREFLVSHDTVELQQIFYNTNTNLGASFGTNTMGSGWQTVIDARRDLSDLRTELGVEAPATAPEVIPEPAVVPDATEYLSSLEERGLMGDAVTLTREDFDPDSSMAELQAYLDGIDAADRIALDNAEAERLAASGAPLTGAEPIVTLEDGTMPFADAVDPQTLTEADPALQTRSSPTLAAATPS